MKMVIAMDSLKRSLSAVDVVATGIKKGFKGKKLELIKLPLADGGEGTVEALVKATEGRFVQRETTGPLGDRVAGFFGILGDGETAVIEMAAASGLLLLPPEKRNPLYTTTYGTGELIRYALDMGCRKLIIGIGGSATNDGGAGLAQALGAKLMDCDRKEIKRGGGALSSLHFIDISGLDVRLGEAEILVACDVDNPLYGERGAARVYGPQKGATPEMVKALDAALMQYA